MALEPREPQSGQHSGDDADLRRRAAFLEQEVSLLRAKISESPRHMRVLEDRLTARSAVGSTWPNRTDAQRRARWHSRARAPFLHDLLSQ